MRCFFQQILWYLSLTTIKHNFYYTISCINFDVVLHPITGFVLLISKFLSIHSKQFLNFIAYSLINKTPIFCDNLTGVGHQQQQHRHRLSKSSSNNHFPVEYIPLQSWAVRFNMIPPLLKTSRGGFKRVNEWWRLCLEFRFMGCLGTHLSSNEWFLLSCFLPRAVSCNLAGMFTNGRFIGWLVVDASLLIFNLDVNFRTTSTEFVWLSDECFAHLFLNATLELFLMWHTWQTVIHWRNLLKFLPNCVESTKIHFTFYLHHNTMTWIFPAAQKNQGVKMSFTIASPPLDKQRRCTPCRTIIHLFHNFSRNSRRINNHNVTTSARCGCNAQWKPNRLQTGCTLHLALCKMWLATAAIVLSFGGGTYSTLPAAAIPFRKVSTTAHWMLWTAIPRNHRSEFAQFVTVLVSCRRCHS